MQLVHSNIKNNVYVVEESYNAEWPYQLNALTLFCATARVIAHFFLALDYKLIQHAERNLKATAKKPQAYK